MYFSGLKRHMTSWE